MNSITRAAAKILNEAEITLPEAFGGTGKNGRVTVIDVRKFVAANTRTQRKAPVNDPITVIVSTSGLRAMFSRAISRIFQLNR